MTRREKIVSELGLNEIVQESIKRHPRFADKRVGFIDGAEWMQKKMIQKAWDWFYNMALDYMSGDITDVKWGSMKEDFFKAMED